MRYSGNSFWRASLSALISVGLLTMPVGPSYASPDLGPPAATHLAPPINGEASAPLTPPSADGEARARISERYGKLPLRFEANAGQTDGRVRFLSRGSGYNLFLTPTEAVLALRNGKATSATDRRSTVRMKLVNANPVPQMKGVDAMPGKSNYLIGKDPNRWRRNVTSYTKVRYQGVYPGIDLIYYGNQQQLEYDFIVAPGVDPNTIRLTFDGVQRVEMEANGDLALSTAAGDVRQRKPVVYQEVSGGRREIASSYVLTGKGEVGFKVAAYDRTRTLVIDPALDYSTYLGGSGLDAALDIAVDSAGHAYVTGHTYSADFPTNAPLQPVIGASNGSTDAVVAKFNREGTGLIYSTFLGGSDYDGGGAVAVNENGEAYVSGYTYSTDFPTGNAMQPANAGIRDLFISRLKSDGSGFVFSTYFGGSNFDICWSMALDRAGNVYVAGDTSSADLPTRNPLQATLAGIPDAFAAKLKSDGSGLIFSTYLGGVNYESLFRIAADDSGNLYLTGITLSSDFPIVNAMQPTLRGFADAFVTKLDATGNAFIYSTYLGGDNYEWGTGIAVDTSGQVYVAGMTWSANFPTVNPLQPAPADTADAFVSKLDRTGSALLYSTYLGGDDFDEAFDIEADSRGGVYVTGITYSTDFPTADSLQPAPDPNPSQGGYRNAFVTRIDTGSSRLIYSSYVGGSGDDSGWAIALDVRGNVYLVGGTGSIDLPTTPEAFQRETRSPTVGFDNGDAFIIKIDNRRPHLQGDDISDADRE